MPVVFVMSFDTEDVYRLASSTSGIEHYINTYMKDSTSYCVIDSRIIHEGESINEIKAGFIEEVKTLSADFLSSTIFYCQRPLPKLSWITQSQNVPRDEFDKAVRQKQREVYRKNAAKKSEKIPELFSDLESPF